ncbi:hypothetical protein [Sphingomonas sp. 3-13AW]|uniref:hypothetical protein n=1 Tax=Sphingomonas sp. 3-13AW TaxID=3050450 RepID=UPI003BB6EAC7
MALSFRLEAYPEFAADVERIREISAWVSTGGLSDMEASLLPLLGALIGTMRSRNLVFHEDLPMAPQFISFLEALPDPLPGQPGYLDQTTLRPLDRRDTFEAEVDLADVRIWTAADQIPRGLARTCSIRPAGAVAGEGMIFAEGGETALLEEGVTRTLILRSFGGALRIVHKPTNLEQP